ncbi:DUF3422 domain-containing protein [Pseudomonas yamanorum]|uniref:DUF3422 domain-containing protein n=1 Tax=Pseudomonas yamanorum TaxID=515393 RepID=UPI0015A127B6|nr:DUF3422 domain-containing protein [Pseudomonas yamanorum]NWD25698.1 DUF3422 domain-containing protein [Pseudomonas yamanorum]
MHPFKRDLHNELHARPSIQIEGPAEVFHLVILLDGRDAEFVVARITGGTDARPHGLVTAGGVGYKWEQHGEFLTVTCVVPDNHNRWLATPESINRLVTDHSAQVISFSQLKVVNQRDIDGIAQFGFVDPAGSTIGQEDASIWSDFRLTAEGTCRYLLVNDSLNAYRLGRMVRRILEMETYRMMALLGLPTAQSASLALGKFEKRLSELSDQAAQPSNIHTRTIVDEAAQLSARATRLIVDSQKRFSATSAYANLVFERVKELREGHTGDCQRFGVFIERRFRPSVRYCAAIQTRLEHTSTGISNLSALLQARAQVEVEDQNAQILQSLNMRASTQIKIQKAVESLSMIATTYYLLSLLKILYEGAAKLGLNIPTAYAVTLAIPLTMAVVWYSRSKVREL